MKKKRKSNFKNQVVSDAQRQKRQASSYGYLNLPKGTKVFSLKEKTREVYLDFLPYEVTTSNHPDRDDDEGRAVPGSLWYKRPFKIHRNVGADNDSVVCLTSIKKKCPICEFVAKKRKEGADWEEIKSIAPSNRNLYIVRPIESKDHDEITHVWDMSQYLFQDELNEQLEEDNENGIFPDLEEGKTLQIKFKWKTLGKNSYPETRDIIFEDREEQYNEDILDEVPNLDELLNILSYKELEAKFFEMEEDEDEGSETFKEDEDDDKDKPTTRKSKSTKKHKKKEPAPEPEEDEVEDEVKYREEKLERKTSRRRRGAQSDKKDKCPHGHKFGEDWDKYDECDECDEWDPCSEAQDK